MKKTHVILMGSDRAIVALLEKTETSEVPGLAEARAAFITEVNEATALAQRQAQRLKPVFEGRNAAFIRLETAVAQVGGQALSFAERTGRGELATKLRVKPSELSEASFERRVTTAQGVHDTLVEALPLLAEAGITVAALTGLQEVIAAARSALAEPRSAVVQRSEATMLLEAKHRRLRRMVRTQLDPLFRPLRRTNPGLYHKYKLARKRLERSAARSGEGNDSLPEQSPANAAAAITNLQPVEVKLAA